jgi:hypothetical protein
MTESRFDPVAMLRALRDHEVRFLVIGGYAGSLLGAPLATNDLDICYERSPDNMERLAAALLELGAKLRVARVDEDLPFILDARTLAAGDSFTFQTPLGAIDVLATPSGTHGYRDLAAGASRCPVAADFEVDVVSLDDLMRMKRANGRTKDRMQLETLAALKEMLENPE